MFVMRRKERRLASEASPATSLETLAGRLLAGELQIRELSQADPRYEPSVRKWLGLLQTYEAGYRPNPGRCQGG